MPYTDEASIVARIMRRDETDRKAALIVCEYATDMTEAVTLLDMLGLRDAPDAMSPSYLPRTYG